jgi:hypothetical protein
VTAQLRGSGTAQAQLERLATEVGGPRLQQQCLSQHGREAGQYRVHNSLHV